MQSGYRQYWLLWHNNKAKYGWYRYDTRFAIPKYDNDGELAGYNIFRGETCDKTCQRW